VLAGLNCPIPTKAGGKSAGESKCRTANGALRMVINLSPTGLVGARRLGSPTAWLLYCSCSPFQKLYRSCSTIWQLFLLNFKIIYSQSFLRPIKPCWADSEHFSREKKNTFYICRKNFYGAFFHYKDYYYLV